MKVLSKIQLLTKKLLHHSPRRSRTCRHNSTILSKFLLASEKLHHDLSTQSELVKAALVDLEDDRQWDSVTKKVAEIQQWKNSNHSSQVHNHLCAVAEFMPALGCFKQKDVIQRNHELFKLCRNFSASRSILLVTCKTSSKLPNFSSSELTRSLRPAECG